MTLDGAATARIAAAYKGEADKWEGLIETAAHDVSLTRDRRAAVIAGLRRRQQEAARGVQRKTAEEETQKLNAYREFVRRLVNRSKAELRPAA